MKWFGKSWGAPVCAESDRVDVPIGIDCYQCSKPIDVTDQGITMPFSGGPKDPPELSAHLGCFLHALGLEHSMKVVIE